MFYNVLLWTIIYLVSCYELTWLQDLQSFRILNTGNSLHTNSITLHTLNTSLPSDNVLSWPDLISYTLDSIPLFCFWCLLQKEVLSINLWTLDHGTLLQRSFNWKKMMKYDIGLKSTDQFWRSYFLHQSIWMTDIVAICYVILKYRWDHL